VKQRTSKRNISDAFYGTGYKTAGRDRSSAFFINSSVILYELMCRFGLASLLEESQRRVCVSGEDKGRIWLMELLLMRLGRLLCLKEV